MLAQLGYPFWAVALSHKNKKVNDFFVAQRARKGVNVIALGKAVRSCISEIRNNHMVALVGDRDFTEVGNVIIRKPAAPGMENRKGVDRKSVV